jgi:hypothetical protein
MAFVGHLLHRLLGVRNDRFPDTGKIWAPSGWLLRRRDNRNALPSWSPLVLFSSGKNAHITAAMVREMIFPEPRVLRQIFPDRPYLPAWQLYLHRMGQMLGMRK